MLYQVKLPDSTRERLTDVVYLQMRLLRYAASTSTLSQDSCERYFKGYKRFRGRHQQIAEWICRGHKKRELLEHFYQGKQSEKLEWSQCLFHEVLALLNNPVGAVTPYIEGESTPLWKKAGAEFLRKFYKEYLSRGLPENFFSEPGVNIIRKADIREKFRNTNKHLLICPACDISTSRTQIDHYLPISIYPHLSCHPFNLVPVCGDCNSVMIKGNTDFLEKDTLTRRKLEDILLPYRDEGLANSIYLKFDITDSYRKPTTLELKQHITRDLSEYIELYCSAYKITDRWLNEENFGSIQYELFKNIKTKLEYAKNSKTFSDINIFDVRDCLDKLLVNLDESKGKTKFTLPMTWWLATLIEKEVKPAISSSQPIEVKNFPLLEEIADWIRQDDIQHPAYTQEPHLQQARNLRKIVAEEG